MLDDINVTIYLIRHAQSEANLNKDVIGQDPNSKLTHLGINQANLLNKKFIKTNQKFDYVFSSSYFRALETAKIVTNNFCNYIIETDELVEYNAGLWSGAMKADILEESIKLTMARQGSSFLFPGGESINMVERRASKWLEDYVIYNKDVRQLYQIKKDPVNVAIFSHGITIRSLLHYVMGFDSKITTKISIDNTSVTKLSFNNDGWHIHNINDCSHLF